MTSRKKLEMNHKETSSPLFALANAFYFTVNVDTAKFTFQ